MNTIDKWIDNQRFGTDNAEIEYLFDLSGDSDFTEEDWNAMETERMLTEISQRDWIKDWINQTVESHVRIQMELNASFWRKHFHLDNI